MHFIYLLPFVYLSISFERDHRLAQAFRPSVCSWWISMAQLTLWKWCPLTLSERGNALYLFVNVNTVRVVETREAKSRFFHILPTSAPLPPLSPPLPPPIYFPRVSFSAWPLQRQLHLHGDLDQQHPPRGSLAESHPEPVSAVCVRGYHGGLLRGE